MAGPPRPSRISRADSHTMRACVTMAFGASPLNRPCASWSIRKPPCSRSMEPGYQNARMFSVRFFSSARHRRPQVGGGLRGAGTASQQRSASEQRTREANRNRMRIVNSCRPDDPVGDAQQMAVAKAGLGQAPPRPARCRRRPAPWTRSRPNSDGYVGLSSAASFPAVLPSSSGAPSTSRMSSTIWKTSPTSAPKRSTGGHLRVGAAGHDGAGDSRGANQRAGLHRVHGLQAARHQATAAPVRGFRSCRPLPGPRPVRRPCRGAPAAVAMRSMTRSLRSASAASAPLAARARAARTPR